MSKDNQASATADKTDVVIVGAGPVGLFAAFQLGLFGFKSKIVDACGRPGGQCVEYYADKPIYDIPAWPSITGEELIDRLLEQVSSFDPVMELGTVATTLKKAPDGHFTIGTSVGTHTDASAVIIAGGWGVIGSTRAEPGIGDWEVGFKDDVLPVEPSSFQTSSNGIFSIGDMCIYSGKLRLILSGFHEAALATQAIRKLADPSSRTVSQYTSTSTELQRNLGVTKPA